MICATATTGRPRWHTRAHARSNQRRIATEPSRSGSDGRGPMTSRRDFLWQADGIGGTAFAWLLGRDAAAMPCHFAPKAKRVVQVFAAGGVSHVDAFDYKPELEKRHGEELTGKGKIDTFFGKPGRLMKSPF